MSDIQTLNEKVEEIEKLAEELCKGMFNKSLKEYLKEQEGNDE